MKKEYSGFRNDSEEVEEDIAKENWHIIYNSILIERLFLDPKFLISLSRFSRFIVYANAFLTDIAVLSYLMIVVGVKGGVHNFAQLIPVYV